MYELTFFTQARDGLTLIYLHNSRMCKRVWASGEMVLETGEHRLYMLALSCPHPAMTLVLASTQLSKGQEGSTLRNFSASST